MAGKKGVLTTRGQSNQSEVIRLQNEIENIKKHHQSIEQINANTLSTQNDHIEILCQSNEQLRERIQQLIEENNQLREQLQQKDAQLRNLIKQKSPTSVYQLLSQVRHQINKTLLTTDQMNHPMYVLITNLINKLSPSYDELVDPNSSSTSATLNSASPLLDLPTTGIDRSTEVKKDFFNVIDDYMNHLPKMEPFGYKVKLNAQKSKIVIRTPSAASNKRPDESSADQQPKTKFRAK